jgi:hypothetical protein
MKLNELVFRPTNRDASSRLDADLNGMAIVDYLQGHWKVVKVDWLEV